MIKEKLPIGIQSFTKIRTEGFAYVDKTHYISSLTNQGSYFFLSRPRRFGKSLFVDTLDCAFRGKKSYSEIFISDQVNQDGILTGYPQFSGSTGRFLLPDHRKISRFELRR
nr:AAA family ATPase [uncultured Methanospirillum sp.]